MSDAFGEPNQASSAYRRMFFVGLGGSGGKTLRFLKRDLNAWLEARGWNGGIPQGWQFLHIDTPTVADGAEVDVAMLPDSEYLGLVGPGETLENLDRGLFPTHSEHRHVGSSWRVVPQSVNVNIQIGAGQYRAIGRSVALSYLRPIRQALELSWDKLNQPGAQASLSQLYTHIHGTLPAAAVAAPIVVVASSLAGGTGAGLINDVCDLLRELDSDAGESFGILYTPDVFHELTGGSSSGMHPNSLAAFSEVLNGHWWHGDAGGRDFTVPRKTSSLMREAGAIQAIDRTGPAYPFLVGRSNSSGISYEKSIQLFEIVGAALTTWATDITVQSEFLAYTVANWRAAATNLKVEPHALVNKGNPQLNEVALNAFSALGFSRISLGNRYFARYSAERLTRDAVEFLTTHHMTGGEAENLRMRQPGITPPELISRQAETRVDAFMRACGLNMIDVQDGVAEPAGNPFTEVERALRPESLQEHFNTVESESREQVMGANNLIPSEWMTLIKDAVSYGAQHFDSLAAPEIEESLLRWISDRPTVVATEVAKLVSDVGIHIAQVVVEETCRRLNSRNGGVIARIREDLQGYKGYSQEDYWHLQVNQQFADVKSKKIPFGERMSEAIRNGLWFAVYKTGNRIKEISADLIEQFVVGYLEPLSVALTHAAGNLNNERNVVSDWPNWPVNKGPASLSSSSRPPMSEYTVVQPTEFPTLFSRLLEKTVPANDGQDYVRRQASRASVITGDFLDKLKTDSAVRNAQLEEMKPIVISGAWGPDVNKHLSQPRQVSPAVFQVGFRVSDVRSRAERWLRQPNSAFDSFIGCSLRAYLEPTDPSNTGVSSSEMSAREQEFMRAFESAVSASKPLAELDQQLMVNLYPAQQHPRLEVEVSSLPFSGHTLETPLTQRLISLSGKQNVGGYFKTDNQIEHIDITTRLAGPYPMIAISSLLAPIAEAWESLRAGRRTDFWDKRRARRLDEFIPAPQEHILCMLRGWFLGRALGLVIPSRNGGSFEVMPRGKKPGYRNTELPKILLSSSDSWGDEPAIALESLGLAYVDVGVKNSLEPLAGYINLLELGRGGPTDQMDGSSTEVLSDYSPMGDFVERWINTGACNLESGNDKGMENFAIVNGAEPAERRRNLADTLKAIRAEYQASYAQYVSEAMTNANSLTLAPYWPSMYPLIDKALEQLVSAIEPAAESGGPRGAANFLPPQR